MAAKPVIITKTEMEKVLCGGKVPPRFEVDRGQLVAIWDVKRAGTDLGIEVKVYTSIFGAESRGVGEDSIRVCVVDAKADKGLNKTTYTTRTTGWELRLTGKIRDMFLFAKAIPACSCGRRMALRKNKADGNVFWGCTGYAARECSRTQQFVEVA